jgi:hypothetical protein
MSLFALYAPQALILIFAIALVHFFLMVQSGL